MGLTLLVGDVILSAHRCAGIDAKKGLAGVAARVRPEREACIFLLDFLRKRYKLYKKKDTSFIKNHIALFALFAL